MNERLTILYTGGLRGDLALLPRLYTRLKRLKGAENGARVLLIDVGEACAADDGRASPTEVVAWHCAVTEGRSMIVALDGMGYDIVHAEISAQARAKLGDNLRAAVVSLNQTWMQDKIAVYTLHTIPPYDILERVRLLIYPCDDATQDQDARDGRDPAYRITAVKQIENSLYLPQPKAGQVGRVRLQLPDVESFTEVRSHQPAAELPSEWLPQLLSTDVIDLSPSTPPEPTIAGMIDFIISEARYTQKKAARSAEIDP
ncbi:MAG: hypothetical protein SGI73_05725 [Chloroflexota bacterium]|nr:hypothetical protein [Chloroflexota bacterium]